MRILLVPSAYYPNVGGIEELTRQLCLALDARGHAPSVLTNRWPDDLPREDVLGGVRVARRFFPLPASRPGALARFSVRAPAALREVLAYVSAVRPDAVHVIGAGPPAAYFALLKPFMATRLVFTGQGELTFDAAGSFDRSLSLRLGLRLMLRRADVVTGCSGFVLRGLAAFGPIRAQTAVVPNGVNPADFDSARATAEKAREIVAVGRLVPQKGFDVLLKALSMDALVGVKLTIAGDGPERWRLEQLAEALGLKERACFVGSLGRDEVARLLGQASVFAFPSRGEPFGIALLEAMAAGVPAVAAAGGGVPELAVDGANALVVPPDRPAALATALRRVLDDERLQATLRAGGISTASELTWESIAATYEAFYTGTA